MQVTGTIVLSFLYGRKLYDLFLNKPAVSTDQALPGNMAVARPADVSERNRRLFIPAIVIPISPLLSGCQSDVLTLIDCNIVERRVNRLVASVCIPGSPIRLMATVKGTEHELVDQ